MLEGFLLELRDAKLPVSLKEFLPTMSCVKSSPSRFADPKLSGS